MSPIRLIVATFSVLVCTVAVPAADDGQPCTNGSFEQLDEHGFPVDWSPVGEHVAVSNDSFHGTRSLRLVRTPDTRWLETGLNRGFRPGVGATTIDRVSGGIDFHYKAISADGGQLMICAIPMNDRNLEHTSARRAEFRVPEDHIGDGHWHHGRLKYDYSDDTQVTRVHFAARIVGGPGEMLLDSFAYVDRTGPILRLGSPRIEEDSERPGQRGVLRIPVTNSGDRDAGNVAVTVALPPGLGSEVPSLDIGDLAVDQRVIARVPIEGTREAAEWILVQARGDEASTQARLALRPELEVVNFGPAMPLLTVGHPVTVACVVRNRGNAVVRFAEARFEFPSGVATASVGTLLPGQSDTLAVTWTPERQTPDVAISVILSSDALSQPYQAISHVVVGPDTTPPAPSGELQVLVSDSHAVLENERIRCVFRRHESGWGPGEVFVLRNGTWSLEAQLPRLSRLVICDDQNPRREFTITTVQPPRAEFARLVFETQVGAEVGSPWHVNAQFALNENTSILDIDYQLRSEAGGRLLAFDGPLFHVLHREEAIFPGLEWLVDDEYSSSTLDIALGHPDQIRYVVHPNMVTVPAIGIHSQGTTIGLMWDIHQQWDGQHDRPSVVFASPDRFGNYQSHLMGLFLPTLPGWVSRNEREALVPYSMSPDQTLRLRCQLVAEADVPDALSTVDRWLDRYGFPRSAPLPRGSYADEIAFSMRGYLESLWIDESQQWWTSKGGGILSTKGRPRTYVADLLIGELLSPDTTVADACRSRASDVAAQIGGPARIDYQRFGPRMDRAHVQPTWIAGLLQSRRPDGTWAFDADRQGEGPFAGVDYRDLGPHGAVELGTTAFHAYQVLRYVRIAGDHDTYRMMLPTLEAMAAFRVPRAAQVWEVPVHSPDVLAASHAIDAFLEAYHFSGETRWLEESVRWARRGLPFIYQWHDPQLPFLAGASIPVYGATWFQGSWFGQPVQWNGLCYAQSLLRLARYDRQRDWRALAETIVHSAILQQDTDGDNATLWPDSISALDGEKCPWVFAPRQIVQNVLTLIDRHEEVATQIVGTGHERLHVSTTANLSDLAWNQRTLQFTAEFPGGEQGCILVANVARPTAVALDGETVAERTDVERGDEAGWRYESATALLTIRVIRSGPVGVTVRGAAFRYVTRLPETARTIDFEFSGSTRGWVEAQHISDLAAIDDSLVGNITGPDPYLVRTMMDVAAESNPILVIRLRLTNGRDGQLFWTTRASPGFDERKSIHFPVVADDQFHDIRIPVGSHPEWTGHITGLRIDPGGGATSGKFAIAHVRGEH